MAKPTDVLHWADSPTTLREEPSEPTKSAGFSVLTKLPAQFFNYLIGVLADWITWISTRIFDAYTLATVGEDCLLYGDATTGLTVRNAAGTTLPVICADPTNTPGLVEAVTTNYLFKHIDAFIAYWEDYGGSPLAIATANKTYLPFASYTPSIAAQQITPNSDTLEFDNIGIYHVDVEVRWANGPAAPYARSIIIDVGGTEYTSFLMNEVSASTARTHHFSMDVEIANIATDVLKVAMYQASGSNDYVAVAGVSVHQVGARV